MWKDKTNLTPIIEATTDGKAFLINFKIEKRYNPYELQHEINRMRQIVLAYDYNRRWLQPHAPVTKSIFAETEKEQYYDTRRKTNFN